MKKIAFCFLIYDIIIHEELWNIFFQNVDKNKYTIYIHYKTNTPSKYFEDYKLNNCIETHYGGISIVKAQNILLNTGLKDIDNQIFIFLSGACIPFKSFNYIYENLNDGYSYFNIAPDRQCFPRCDYTLQFLDKSTIKKANTMSIINRKLANQIIKIGGAKNTQRGKGITAGKIERQRLGKCKGQNKATCRKEETQRHQAARGSATARR